jgi:MFS family permease
MRGTGRFSAALGAVNTAQGIGAALSTTIAGIVVVHAGYSAAFVTLAAVAAAGLLLFLFAMPETAPAAAPSRNDVVRGDDVTPVARTAAE